MKVDLSSFEAWENINAKVAADLQIESGVTVRCFPGLPAAIFEMLISTAQFYSHKRSVAIIGGQTPHLQSVMPYLYKEGYEVQIRPRSGLALKFGITVLNSPGTIDSDYRGEIGVILINHGNNYFEVRKGDRIAQMVISKLYRPTSVTIGDILPDTERGESGFGSTGFGLSGLAGSIL